MKLLMEKWEKFLNEEASIAGDIMSSASENSLEIVLPKFILSEKWGEPGTDEREIIEMFTSKIKGSSFQEKINSLQSFVSECDKRCAEAKTVPEILSSLVFLDSLASLIYDFNDKTGGFLFESIVAALLGGSASQVPTAGGPNQAIEDLVDHEGNPLSLKLLFAGPKYISGSESNLDKAVRKYKKPIKYLVAMKNRKHKTGEVLSIDFYEFTIGDRSQKIYGDFDSTDLGRKTIYTPYLSEYKIANLDFGSRKRLKGIAQNYADALGSDLIKVYNQIDQLSRNINKYFLENDKAKALEARQNAEILKRETEKFQ